MSPLLHLTMVWIAWYALHSLLASHPGRRFLTSLLPGQGRWYRLGYNLFAVGSILYPSWLYLSIPGEFFWNETFSYITGLGLIAGGLLFVREVFKSYDTGIFLGTTTGINDWAKGQELLIDGWHRRVRHPLYTGISLILIGAFLVLPTGPSLIVVGISFGYLFIGIRLEERKLIQQHGKRYLSYRRQVPMLVPAFRNKKERDIVTIQKQGGDMNPATLWPKGLTYEAYTAEMKAYAKEGKTSGPEQTDSLIHYTRLNASRMRRIGKTTPLLPDILEQLANLEKSYTWKVFTESWCGDAAQVLPVLGLIAEASDQIDLDILYRDEHPDLFAQYLTNGAKSIPKLVAIDGDSGKELGRWGPRPEILQARVMAHKAAPDQPQTEFMEEIQQWYNNNKGGQIQTEILRALRSWEQV